MHLNIWSQLVTNCNIISEYFSGFSFPTLARPMTLQGCMSDKLLLDTESWFWSLLSSHEDWEWSFAMHFGAKGLVTDNKWHIFLVFASSDIYKITCSNNCEQAAVINSTPCYSQL